MEDNKNKNALTDEQLEEVSGGGVGKDIVIEHTVPDDNSEKKCFTEIFMAGGLTSPGDCANCDLYNRCGNASKLPIPQPLDTPLPTTDIIIKW